MELELNIPKEIVAPDFVILKGHNSFIFGMKGIEKEDQKKINDAINCLKAEIFFDEEDNLTLDIVDKKYYFNLDQYHSFFSSTKFYVGFDFIDEKNNVKNPYRRLFTIEKK